MGFEAEEADVASERLRLLAALMEGDDDFIGK